MPTPYPAPTRRLPAEPSLEQLKKQAKDLLEQFRAGDAAASAEVRQFERDPDAAVFALNDAQRVLARAYGYASWPRLKAFVDGANVAALAGAVKAGDLARVRSLLRARPELVSMDRAENDEHRALHYAVLRRDVPMVRLLMESGADARKGIYPHRDATSALTIARSAARRSGLSAGAVGLPPATGTNGPPSARLTPNSANRCRTSTPAEASTRAN